MGKALEGGTRPGRERLTRAKPKEPLASSLNPNNLKPRLGLSGVKAAGETAADIDRSIESKVEFVSRHTNDQGKMP